MSAAFDPYGSDIYTEPDADPNTLAHLGPLAPLAGLWQGPKGVDDHPVVDGTEQDVFVERYDLQPIDPQTNGPQLMYGLRYHTHIVKPGEIETFHDQVGYWLWEPVTGAVTHTLTIPRGQVVVAGGTAEPNATEFEVAAAAGSEVHGISSIPFLADVFRTLSFRLRVTVNENGTWSYDEEALLQIPGREPFVHRDRNTLSRVAPPKLNPLSAADGRGGLAIGSLRGRSLPT